MSQGFGPVDASIRPNTNKSPWYGISRGATVGPTPKLVNGGRSLLESLPPRVLPYAEVRCCALTAVNLP